MARKGKKRELLLNSNHPQKRKKTTQEAAAPINLEQNAPVIKVLASTSNADVMQPLNIAEPVETLNKLVSAPVVTPPNIKETGSIDQKEKADVYSELMRLEEIPLITNSEAFECEVCIKQCNVNEGAILRECIHMVCKVCLADVIKMCQELVVNCPVTGCPGALQDREIRALVAPEDFEKWMSRCFDNIESGPVANNATSSNLETGYKEQTEGSNMYTELRRLEESALITNSETLIECESCRKQCNVNEGVILRECLHMFCKGCVADVIKMCKEPVVHCPATGCPGALQEREIRALVTPEDFEKWVSRCYHKAVEMLNKIESAPVVNNATTSSSEPGGSTRQTEGSNIYSELMRLEESALITNSEAFECEVCMEQCNVNDGVVLRECIHKFCKGCLADVIKMCQEPEVHCPATGCPGALQEREIRALVAPEEFEKVLSRRLSIAESGSGNSFHCRTTDCVGWALCDPEVETFYCPVCFKHNCLSCKAIHEGENCKQYRARMEAERISKVNKLDLKTQTYLKRLISKRKVMPCPKCGVLLTKTVGCDWLVCSACKTEICWATRGPRWGPKGRGDTSGGCRCRVKKGKRCHPSCLDCH